MSLRPAQQQTKSIEELSENMLVLVFSFLSHHDQAIASLVNRRWYAISQSPTLWLYVTYYHKSIADPALYTAWFTERLSNPSLRIHELTINDSGENFSASQIAEIFQQPRLQLETLKLSLYHLSETEQILLSLLLVKSCPNLKVFSTHGDFLSDATMEFFPLLTHLVDLRVLCSSPDFTGIHLQALPPLQKVAYHTLLLSSPPVLPQLHLLPHMIDFNNLHMIISKSRDTLRELAIDTDNLTSKEIITIIDLLPKELVTIIKFSYCEDFDDEVFARLADFAELTKLKFYKASEVSRSAYIQCFRSFKSTSLLELDLKECNELCDEGLIAILAKSKQLRVIKLGWQRDITSKSISFMFTHCTLISFVSLQGVKQLNAQAFPYLADFLPLFNSKKYAQLRRESQYKDEYDKDCLNNQLFAQANISEYFFADVQAHKQRVDCYSSLRFIDCTKSDLVPDEALEVLHLLNPMLTALNYYGEKM